MTKLSFPPAFEFCVSIFTFFVTAFYYKVIIDSAVVFQFLSGNFDFSLVSDSY